MVRSRAALPVGKALMAVAIIVSILLVSASAKLAHAATTFTVNSTADPGTDGCDATECTLREAINAANGATGADTIDFDVSGTGCAGGVCTIGPSSELPIITQPVLINGYTQGDGTSGDPSDDARPNTLAAGNDAELKIKVDGSVLDGAVDTGNGLKIEADNSTVKGLVISNWDNGIFLSVDATGNSVRGNFIGTDASGSNLSNNIGVALTNASNNTIGGTTAAERNLISGNSTWGVRISDPESMGNKVRGNFIGTDVTGTVTDPDGSPNSGDELGNGLNGVSIQTGADDNTIGGTAAGAGNIISGNGYNGSELNHTKSGVEVQFVNGDLPTGNRILSNSIYDNVKLGIDLYFTNNPPGVTDNDPDPLDTDSGPNNLQNFPEITSARLTTRRIGGDRTRVTVIRGTLKSEATKTYNVQFFSSPTADASGYGEGKRFLGQETVETLGSGDASFIFITRKRVPKQQVVAATATDQSTDDTSEFSLATTVT